MIEYYRRPAIFDDEEFKLLTQLCTYFNFVCTRVHRDYLFSVLISDLIDHDLRNISHKIFFTFCDLLEQQGYNIDSYIMSSDTLCKYVDNTLQTFEPDNENYSIIGIRLNYRHST